MAASAAWAHAKCSRMPRTMPLSSMAMAIARCVASVVCWSSVATPSRRRARHAQAVARVVCTSAAVRHVARSRTLSAAWYAMAQSHWRRCSREHCPRSIRRRRRARAAAMIRAMGSGRWLTWRRRMARAAWSRVRRVMPPPPALSRQNPPAWARSACCARWQRPMRQGRSAPPHCPRSRSRAFAACLWPSR